MTAPVEIEIRIMSVTLQNIEATARAAQAALDDLPPPFECNPRHLRQRDRLGEILIHSANAHRYAKEIEVRLAAVICCANEVLTD